MDELFLGRQPILDGEGRIVAFELLFRGSDAERAEVSDDTQASAHVIAGAFGTLGLGLAQGNCRYYVNVGRELLLSDAIELIPREHVTLELLETIRVDDAVVDRCRQLAAKGYRLALDDFVYREEWEPLLELAHVVKVDLTLQGLDRAEELAHRIRAARPGKAPLFLAEKVERREEFERLRRQGFDLFQGYFFARPHQLSTRRVDPSAVAMLKVLEIVIRDGETADIEDAIKGDPVLCYNLLRLANSVALGAGRAVASLRQAVVLLGRQQIRRWLQLLIFARRSGGDSGGALLHLAASRGKLMELLAGGDGEGRDKAFTIGILSLVDILLDLPMEEIVAQVNLGDEIRQALLERKGEFGELLRLCEILEAEEQSPRGLLPPGTNGAAMMKAQIEALSWANGLIAAIH
ncbi:MAG: EAL and HDOD domain-containing protein [Sulfuricellaceae bacterium]|jgi:c-di-GMP-related signal transduction protein